MKTLFPFVLAVLCCSVAHAQGPFDNVNPSRFGYAFDTPEDVRLLDVDGDGDLDLAISHGVTNQYNPDIWKTLAVNHDGEFGPEGPNFPNHYGEDFSTYVFTDIDNDGDTDALYNGLWAIYDGLEYTVEPVGTPWVNAVLVDLELDGDLDIVAIEDNRVVSYFMQPDGTYSEPTVIKDDFSGGEFIATADLNLDGYPDLVASWNTNIWWWANNDLGGFGGGNNVDNTSSEGLLLADIDGDGVPDICEPGTYRRNNIGSYNDPLSLGGTDLEDLRFHDVDLDGDLDIFGLANQGLGWYENLDDAGFAAGTIFLDAATSLEGGTMGDIDGDGIEEAVLATASDEVRVWRHTGSFDWTPDEHWVTGPGAATGDVAAADLTGNGKDEVISNGANIYWSAPGYLKYRIYDGGNYGELETNDVDGDGDLDVVFTDTEGGAGWLANDGLGNFPDPANIFTSLAAPEAMQMDDMDDDGDLDVVVSNSAGVYWFEDTGTTISTMHTVWEGELSDPDLELGDGNQDGLPDVYLRSPDSHACWAVWSDGTGGFADPEVILTSPHLLQDLETSDFNMDGSTDLFIGTYTDVWNDVPSGHLLYLEADATGFAPVDTVQEITIGWNEWSYLSECIEADLDLDGDPDLVVYHYTAGRMDFVMNDGTGGVEEYYVETWISSILNSWDDGAVGNLDGFGGPDVYLRLSDIPYLLENEFGLGCTDPEACNFDPESLFEDGSCCYVCGCTHSWAANYDPEATCNDGSCIYTINGFVYDDEDEDGQYEEGDLPLPFTEVLVTPGDILLITDDFGNFSIDLPGGGYQFQTQNHPVFPYVTTTNPRSVGTTSSYWGSNQVLFGLGKDIPQFSICADFYPSSGGLCDTPRNYNICFRNNGNYPIDGYLEIEYDTLFQGYQEVTPIDSVVDNKIYLGFEDLNPGAMYFYDVKLITPTTDFIGEELESVVRMYGFFEGEQVAYGEQVRTEIVTCAYDPNDKQAFPIGETEDHLLREDQTQEFVVRFQNTGNAPAQNIMIRDTLDVNFDLDSFEFVANSHSVQTTLNPETRELTFFFPEIMLPDSNCCEPESHGLVSYKIRPLPGLPAGTRLENTAYIFFDNNPPIVTNTTWTTLHECRDWLNLEASTDADCFGDQLLISSDYDNSIAWPQTYLWTNEAGTTTYGTELILDYEVDDPIDEVLSLTATNPLCTEQGWVSIDFVPLNLPGSCTGDLNCDAIVGTDDLILFLGEYGCSGESCLYDLDGDAAVLAEDLLLVLGAFGTTCE